MAISPLNDYMWTATLRQRDVTTGALSDITSGTVTAFLATHHDADAVAADATLNCTVNYSGAGAAWTVSIDASVLTKALLDTLFSTTGRIYLIVKKAGAILVWYEEEYESSRRAEAA
jgi:hypothetical protein